MRVFDGKGFKGVGLQRVRMFIDMGVLGLGCSMGNFHMVE